MSMAPVERIEHTLAIETLKAALKQANDRAARWEIWATKLEIQMRREGWTEEDIEDLALNGIGRPK